ncbi:ATP-binding protein [Agathobacter sp.]
MALTNAQYDEIMRGYDKRQLQNKYIRDKRIENAYRLAPRLKEIDDGIASASVQQAYRLMDGDKSALSALRATIEDYKEERAALLGTLGFPQDYFDPIYTCPDCHDTGYIDGQKCHCFKQAIINTVYSQSNIREILERENFSTLTYDFYSDSQINPATGLSALQTARQAVAECHNFIDNFNDKPKNLLFYGDTGVGKTFLSNCIARDLLDAGYSVIYFTAFQLFDILSKGVFEKDADAIAAHQNIFDCDLLIIDDLGTELANSFTTSQLFLCVNERILRQKSTIISTNLSLGQIVDVYSERTLSRISSNYTIIKLFGDDIRIKKRSLK